MLEQAEQDRRQWPRLKVDAKGEVVYLKHGLRGIASVPCKIVDVSDGGALLDVESLPLPDDIVLIVENNVKISCRIVRRDGDSVGVRFL